MLFSDSRVLFGYQGNQNWCFERSRFEFTQAWTRAWQLCAILCRPCSGYPLAKLKYEEKDKGGPRMNSQIHAQYVRLVTDEGHSVVSRNEALERAKKLNLDLVEVQPDGNPPVCKLMDYKKEMYLKQVKEKEQSKKKSDLVLRKGGLKEVRITFKIDKHDMKTKADAIKRLAERGHRVKCMAVKVPNEKSDEQDLGGLLSRLSAMIDDFALVESGPRVEEKQAYVVVRHIKFGPLKKGPAKKKISEMVNEISTQSSEEQSLNESDSETDTYDEKEMELDSTDDFDHVVKPAPAPETFNRYAATRKTNRSENRYATTRPTNGSGQSQNVNRRGPGEATSGYGRFDAPRPNNDHRTESGPVEVNRYMKGPRPQGPSLQGDFGRENNNMNPAGVRVRQGGYRR
ncbi:uncharacterized protein LOC143563453 isoform X2 [Bidens hawaiensis]|uniref:uncharacterized protein LOC143563453 isoform X2 n=1 Tax=Bidens hawaiensis TaxID=980011 RepID=UPI0040492077